MPKLLSDVDMAQIVHDAVHNDEVIDDGDAYSAFLDDLADLICSHFGGTHSPTTLSICDGVTWRTKFCVNSCVPADGGIFTRYCPAVVWRDGIEVV